MATGQVSKELIYEAKLNGAPYVAELVDAGSTPFLALSGSRLGRGSTAGGILVPDLWALDDIVSLMRVVYDLKTKGKSLAGPVACVSIGRRVFCGETVESDGRWYYRIKGYSPFFRERDTGEVIFYRDHAIRPAGHGRFIQEFDVPVSAEGKAFVARFAEELYGCLEARLQRSLGRTADDTLDLIRAGVLFADGDLAWVGANPTSEVALRDQPIRSAATGLLMEEGWTTDRLAERLRVSQALANRLVNVGARYGRHYLGSGVLLDRSRSPHGNPQFRATRVPRAVLDDCPLLARLLEVDAGGHWPAWRRVIFSNDDYGQDRLVSLHLAELEVDALCGGLAWSVRPTQQPVQALAVRLFDLGRHFGQDSERLSDLGHLVERFLEATREV
jgi:hypothetical protein